MALVLGRKDLQKDLVHQAQIRFKENNKYEKRKADRVLRTAEGLSPHIPHTEDLVI